MPDSKPLTLPCSQYLLSWLHESNISLALTTYQTNRLFLIGRKPDGSLSTFERLFDRPMGLYAAENRLWMSTRYQLWQIDNVLQPGQLHDKSYDKLYVPRHSHVTGDINAHDIAVDDSGNILFINTELSCLAKASRDYSFEPLWKPPFISELNREDRCHLNGLAMVDGKPRYVTACSRSDVAGGWRSRRRDGGVVMDIESNEILAGGLSMPHSPRWYRDRLWLLNSGTGELGYIEDGKFLPLCFCPGFVRGLAFYGDYAIVGLSKPRHQHFQGLPLDEMLKAKDADAVCGVYIISLSTGKLTHWLELEGVVKELFDVVVLPDTTQPMALGFKTDEIQQLVTYPGGIILPGVQTDPISSNSPDQGQRGDNVHSKTASASSAPYQGGEIEYHYQLSLNLGVRASLEQFGPLTFPPLGKIAAARKINEPLIAVTANHQGQVVGLALAELAPDGQTAEVLSLAVIPDHRGRGVGGKLLDRLGAALKAQKCRGILLKYWGNWHQIKPLEKILSSQGFSQPQTHQILCQSDIETISQAPWLNKYQLPAEFGIFPWAELTETERRQLQAADWYPRSLTPFQEEATLEPLNSLGLRHRGDIIGWCITHRTAPDTIQYTSLYVPPKFQVLGRGILLLSESIRRQIDGQIPHFIWRVDIKSEKVLRFVRRRLVPHSRTVKEHRHATRILPVGGERSPPPNPE